MIPWITSTISSCTVCFIFLYKKISLILWCFVEYDCYYIITGWFSEWAYFENCGSGYKVSGRVDQVTQSRGFACCTTVHDSKLVKCNTPHITLYSLLLFHYVECRGVHFQTPVQAKWKERLALLPVAKTNTPLFSFFFCSFYCWLHCIWMKNLW